MKNNKRVIVCAAIYFRNLDLAIPCVRHYDKNFQKLEKIFSSVLYPDDIERSISEDEIICGFLDNQGNFLTRKDAFDIAVKNGQMTDFQSRGILISEDLY